MITIVIISVCAVIVIYMVIIYNKLITQKNLVEEGWSGIDVQLKQRANLIPNLIATVKGYLSHEKNVLEDVTRIRSECLKPTDVKHRQENENMLTGALRQIFALAENYPDLKASNNFIQLQESLTKIEDQIQFARRYYNGTARDFNITVQSFPSNLVAKGFKFEKAEFFEIEDPAEREVTKIDFTQA